MTVSLGRGQLISTWGSLEASQRRCILVPKRAPVGKWTGNLSIPVATLWPTKPLSFDIKQSGQDFFFVIVLVIVWIFLSHLFIYSLLYVVVKQNSFLFLDLPIFDFYGEFALSLHLINVYKKCKKRKHPTHFTLYDFYSIHPTLTSCYILFTLLKIIQKKKKKDKKTKIY